MSASSSVPLWPSAAITRPDPSQTDVRRRKLRVLPGFSLSLGITLTYLSLVVLIPLLTLFLKTAQLSWPQFWDAVAAPRVTATYALSFGAALAAATLNAVFGLLLAWVLVRYDFPGRKLIDTLVDLPFALPTRGSSFARRRQKREGCGSPPIGIFKNKRLG